MLTIAQAKRELAGYPPHDAAVALHRLACLRAFWTADEAAGGRNRCETRRRVAEQLTAANPKLRVTDTMLERWEMKLRHDGVTRLAMACGRPRNALRMPVIKDLGELSTADLLKHTKRALTVLSLRLASQK